MLSDVSFFQRRKLRRLTVGKPVLFFLSQTLDGEIVCGLAWLGCTSKRVERYRTWTIARSSYKIQGWWRWGTRTIRWLILNHLVRIAWSNLFPIIEQSFQLPNPQTLKITMNSGLSFAKWHLLHPSSFVIQNQQPWTFQDPHLGVLLQ